ncbi:two-component regulator propeller domain-containing protein [Roseateles microcysteis]|uniref:two-component regulator propeller domain-containing protein n=1 Tax=Roseateles microcysteis TaxID=3119057 RepID=UPI002FE6991C
MPPIRVLLVFCVLVLAASAHAGPGLQSLRFEHLLPEQMGSNGSVQCGLQDGLGQMWLGTSYGLVRFDGRRGQLFSADPRDKNSLSHAWVQDLAQLPDGRLLVATAGGLNVFDPATERNERIELPGQRSGPHLTVLSLAPAAGGRWWLQGHFELWLFDPQSRQMQAMTLPGLRPLVAGRRTLLRGLRTDGEGGVWLVAGAELVHVDSRGQVLQRWPLPPFQGSRISLRAMVLDQDGRAWIAGEGGVAVMELASGRALDFPKALGLPVSAINSLWRDHKGGVWLAYGSEGLWHWPRGGLRAESHKRHPALPNSLFSNAVSSVFQDRGGVLWVGTWSGGVSLADLSNSGFSTYRAVHGEPETLAHDSVQAIAPIDAEQAWVASYGGGLDWLELATGRVEHVPSQGQPLKFLRKLLLQPGRGLWIGADDGLFLMDTGSRRVQRIDIGPLGGTSASVGALALAADGSLWAGTDAGLLELVPGLPAQRHKRPQSGSGGLAHDKIQRLLIDKAGRLWVGSEAGLQVREGGRFGALIPVDAALAKPDSLSISGLAQDAQGQVWVGSRLGLHRLEGEGHGRRLSSWSRRLGLPETRIHNLQNAADGALWMSTDAALIRVNPERSSARSYPAGSGPMLAGFGPGSSAAGPDGRLFYGGSGLLAFDPSRLSDNHQAPAVLLSDLRVFNRSLRDEPLPERAGEPATNLAVLGVSGPLERARALRLSHREAMVSFDLRAQHFVGVGQIRYAWKLEGFDRDWIQGKPGEGLATYTNLNAGNFRLMAKAANSDGIWGEPRELLTVEVLPPWWRSLWFRTLVLLALVAGLVTAWQLRLRRLKQTQRELEVEVERRTAQVREQRQQIATLSEIGRELTASLDLQAIQQALFAHVESLMPATAFGVGLVNREERVVEFDYMVERGKAFKPYRRSLDSLEQPAARCVASGEAFMIHEFEHDNRLLDTGVREHEGQRLLLQDGSEPARSRSALYVPLKVKGEVIGILSVLSDLAGAFKQTHLDMLQTLGAYAAVALDNADAYRQLQQAQAQLVEQKKLASLGSLVAGVAHELNTPLGNGLMAASTLQEEARQFVVKAGTGLRRSDVQAFCETAEQGTSLLMRSLNAAARLVASFKQLSVDQSREQRRHFDLADLVAEVERAQANQIQAGGHQLRLSVPEGLTLDSYPEPLTQVLGQLFSNALVHGFSGGQPGVIQLAAEPLGSERLRLRFSDDGQGIAPEDLGRIFDPFFTTTLGSGSNGLGLHLCYTIVGSLLGGQITARSEPGQGATFEIVLPRVAPR